MQLQKSCLSYNGFLKLVSTTPNKTVFLRTALLKVKFIFQLCLSNSPHPTLSLIITCRQGRQILIKNLVPLAALLGACLKMLAACGVSFDNFHFIKLINLKFSVKFYELWNFELLNFVLLHAQVIQCFATHVHVGLHVLQLGSRQ